MQSKRAQLFAEILPFINSNDWERVDDFLVFGSSGFWAYLAGDSAEVSTIDGPIRILAHKTKTLAGRNALLGRSSLIQVPPNSTLDAAVEFWSSISEEQRSKILTDLEEISQLSTGMVDENDVIDAALAESAIHDLERANTRVKAYDALELKPHSGNTAAYFEEAHRCDALGLKVGAAVLCRAILEDSLKAILGTRTPSNFNGIESQFKQMLSQAKDRGLLDQSRVDAADRIRKAGNAAVHDLNWFNRDFRPKMSEIVDDMRKVLEDLNGLKEH